MALHSNKSECMYDGRSRSIHREPLFACPPPVPIPLMSLCVRARACMLAYMINSAIVSASVLTRRGVCTQSKEGCPCVYLENFEGEIDDDDSGDKDDIP